MRTRGFLLIAALGSALCLAGCRAVPPGSTETGVVDWWKLHVTVKGGADHNPFAASPENIADGKQAFDSYCSVCHGMDGQNTGVPFATLISPPVPPLSSHFVQSYSDGQLKYVIENGIRPSGMPPSNGVFNDDDIWKMVLFIRHLPPAGSLGDPPAYAPPAPHSRNPTESNSPVSE